MGIFKTVARRFPDGLALDAIYPGDSNNVTGTAVFDRTAPPLAPDANSALGYKFLYWDTGRHVTTKRHVRWSFTHPTAWTLWTAVAWYGPTPPNIPGQDPHLIQATAHRVEGTPIPPTPISSASTFTNGPAGASAWPFNGSDHVASTQWGAATVRAEPSLIDAGASILFEGWLQLVLGGDDSGEFDETDTGGDVGGQGVYDTSLSPNPDFAVASGGSVDLLAVYAPEGRRRIRFPPGSVLNNPNWQIPPIGDSAVIDLLRQIANRGAAQQAGADAHASDPFTNLVEKAQTMASHELSAAITATESMLRRGQAALQQLQATRNRGK